MPRGHYRRWDAKSLRIRSQRGLLPACDHYYARAVTVINVQQLWWPSQDQNKISLPKFQYNWREAQEALIEEL